MFAYSERVNDAQHPAPRAARSRPAILAAARELILEGGYESLTMEGIASRAGVGKQTLYRWWPSKGGLLADALLSDDATPLLAVAGPSGDGLLWAHGLAAQFSTDAGSSITRALTSAAAEDHSVAAQLHERFTVPLLASIEGWLAEQRPDESPGAAERRHAAADMLIGALVFRVLTRAEPLTVGRAEQVLRLTLASLE